MPKVFKFLFFCFLIIGFLFLFLNYCKAIALEVDYPVIQGQTITSQTSVPEYLKYVFDMGIFIGFFAVFLSLIWAGILYFLSPAIPNALADAKDRISGAISGLLILVLLYLIITTINPGLTIFRTTNLTKVPETPALPPPAGVYIYKSSDCSPPDPAIRNSSILNLQELKRNVRSVKITQNPAENIYYIAVLYESLNLSGKCQYINPNIGCHPNIEPFASSASILRYSYFSEGSVVFYRKPFYDSAGGYLVLKDTNIGGYYVNNLESLRFTDSSAKSQNNPEGCTVPEKERDCVQWNKKGDCVKRECPSLSKNNIGSIKIDGNYFVLLVYFAPSDKPKGPWSYCQAFPTSEDVNKEGPKQLKWENIKNMSSGKIPNWMLIYPVEEK